MGQGKGQKDEQHGSVGIWGTGLSLVSYCRMGMLIDRQTSGQKAGDKPSPPLRMGWTVSLVNLSFSEILFRGCNTGRFTTWEKKRH